MLRPENPNPMTVLRRWRGTLRFRHCVAVSRSPTLAITLLASLLAAPPARALDTVALTDNAGEFPLQGRTEYLVDKTGQLTIDDVRAPRFATQWAHSPSTTLNFGITSDAIWVRFRLSNASARKLHYLEIAHPLHDHIHYWGFVDGRLTKSGSYGDMLPFASRALSYPRFVIFLSIAPGTEATYYLRFESANSMVIPLSVWLPERFAEHVQRVEYVFGLFSGALVALLLFNFFVVLFLRDAAFLFYVLWLSSALGGFFITNGHAYEYLWPGWPWWENHANLAFATSAFIWGPLFARAFLGTSTRDRPLNAVLVFYSGANALLLPVGFFLPLRLWNTIVVTQFILFASLMLVAGLRSLWQGYRPARFFLTGWALLILGVILYPLMLRGTLPDTPITRYSVQVGIVVEAVLLSLALGDRFRYMREQTLHAMSQANTALAESERSLERKVGERTAELAVARDAALAANRAKSTFLANMSHELRTPLNAIIGYGEMLEEDAEEAGHKGYLPDLRKIVSSGKHLLGLINDVLDLSKIEAGKVEVFAEDFSVRELVEEVGATVGPLVERNENHLEIAVARGVGTMHSDQTRLRQVLFNLLSNAAKFTKQGRIQLTVERQSVDGAAWLEFAVTDTGIGISDEQLGKIFDAFSQAKASTTREYGGTGLGLTITKHFCEMMGGVIHVTSQLGRGSRFVVRLPA